MGKLVIYLADGGTVDVILNRERITIGRRPDNDVCLPFPAVSGEHAQVVTILADSFLEDLGSTNGTLVNGKAVAKHFLRDNDSIDIGRQRLTYLSDESVKVEALPPDIAMKQLRGLQDRVESAKVAPKPTVSVGVGSRTGQFRAVSQTELDAVLAEQGSTGREPVVASPAGAAAPTLRPEGKTTTAAASAGAPSVRVLSGASQGRTVAFPGSELTVGRVGVQVAVVRKLGEGGYLLIPLEGREPPRINGAAVSPEGTALHPGDTFEVAGVRLELSVHA